MTQITDSRAADLLCGAFEGGSNYWYMIYDYVNPNNEEAKPWGDEYTPSYISVPFSEKGSVIIADAEEMDEDNPTPYYLNREAIEKGKQLLANNPKYSHHYADVLRENDDADTGDVFLQLCLFGEVVYG